MGKSNRKQSGKQAHELAKKVARARAKEAAARSIDLWLQGESARNFCPVAAEKKRFTTCRCLSHLMLEHRSDLISALVDFVIDFEKLKMVQTQRNYTDKHVFTGNEVRHDCLNAPTNPHYQLLVPLGEDDPSPERNPKYLLLCRSAIMDVTRGHLGSAWDTTEAAFPSIAALQRSIKKRRIFLIINYLLERDFHSAGKKFRWDHESFLSLRIPLKTAWKYVTDYQLREVLRCVRCINTNVDWVRNCLGGCVVAVPDDVVAHGLTVISERGTQSAGYLVVDPASVLTKASETRRVQYRPFDGCNTKDTASLEQIERFRECVAGALQVAEKDITIEASTLKSPGYAPQVPHYDFNSKVLSKHKGRIFIGVTPLSPAGAYLQVWEPHRKTDPGQVVHIPYGTLLILPGDTVHGGGFHSDFKTNDLRLHFYFYIKPAKGAHHDNIYQREDFPMSESLSESGLLDLVFRSEERDYKPLKKTPGNGR